MLDAEALYARLPTPLQNLACSLEGWRLERTRFGGPFHALLRDAEGRTFWSPDQIAAFRDERLRVFVRHCARTVPFYRSLFAELDVSADEIRSLADLERLPVLTRHEVQEHASELISEALPARARRIVRTSGTSGTPLSLATTEAAIQEQAAIWWRWWRWHGIERRTWCGHFGGRVVVPPTHSAPPFWRLNYPGRQVRFSTYHMSPANLPAYARELRRRRLPWLHGWPSALALLAEHVLATDGDLGYAVRHVTVGSGNLTPQRADAIERAFGTRPRENYGLVEAVANFSECGRGALHVDEDFAAVEFVPNRGGPGQVVVGSNFTNFAMPLLRYETGDVVTLADRRCGCGRPGAVVATVDGRLEDYVVLANGARATGLGLIFRKLTNVREAQIYQEQPGEVTIRVVRRVGYGEDDETALLAAARKRLGPTRIDVEYVERIERSASGKPRLVVSRVHGSGSSEGVDLARRDLGDDRAKLA